MMHEPFRFIRKSAHYILFSYNILTASFTLNEVMTTTLRYHAEQTLNIYL